MKIKPCHDHLIFITGNLLPGEMDGLYIEMRPIFFRSSAVLCWAVDFGSFCPVCWLHGCVPPHPLTWFLAGAVVTAHPPTHYCRPALLTHWGRVTHICVSKQTIIGSDNGLSPGRRQAIIWTNAVILLIGTLGTNFSQILIEIGIFSFTKMVWKCRLRNGGHFVSASMC